LGDLNGDGKRDVITANYSGNSVSVLLGNGDGTFQAKSDYGMGPGTRAVAVGDVNGDAKADTVSANYDANTISVLLNAGAKYTCSP
jgi:hypothetical protein